MAGDAYSRRFFLRSAGVIGGTALARLGMPAVAALAGAACTARDSGAGFKVLAAAEARDFAAIAARILPTTDTPGASEAGVIHFFDQAFADDMRDALPAAREGLALLNDTLPDGGFAALPEQEQDAALDAIDGQPFFEQMRLMTLFGFFAMSRYGGNRDHVGWKLIQFDGHHGAWRHPYGHYDAESLEEDADE